MELSQLVHRSARTQKNTLPAAPWVPLVPCAAAAAVLFGMGVAGGLEGSFLLVVPISVACLGLLLALRSWAERDRIRAEADAWIARGYESRASRYGWRIDELTSQRERRVLGRSVRRIVPELAAGRRPGAAPINRFALRPFRSELIALADRLDDLERPVSAAGILGVHRLLTEPGSVLYSRPSVDTPRDIGAELGAILDGLEVCR